MIRIMVMNGLLISLILIWTSAAKEPSAGYLIKSSTKPPTGPLNYSVSKPMVSLHETNKEILRRKFLCGSELGGVCVNKKKSCPSNLPSEKSPGKPYCSKKKDRCCYPDPTTAAPPTVVPTTTTTSEDVNWSDIRNACIKSNNYKTYQPLALDICKEKCVEEDAINCQSIEYSSAQQMCAISEARSDSDDFIEPCFVDGWVFAEIELNAGPTTGAPTTLAPSNTTINGQTTNPPTTTAPSNTTNNVSSCNLVWNYEEDRPLIMIRETKTIVPPIIDIEISEDPNRIPEGKKLIFACPGENNQFNHVQGTHTKLHGECISHEQFKVCVNNYPEILDLSQLSCSSKMQPSIIKQDNDTSYEKSCEDIGGELYKFGYIYGDYREFKDLDTKFCFREKDQTTLWTSTNIDRIEISPSMRSMDPANFRTARGLAMNTFYSQKSQQETLKEILDKEVKSVWNDKACRNHGGHCVRGGRPCPKHLPHHTSQGEPFCTSFYRCCYSDQCDPTTCTYKGKKGNCSLDSLPGTTGVGSQECKKGCQCYIKDNKTLRQFESLQERMGNDQRTRCDGEDATCELEQSPSLKSSINPVLRDGTKACVVNDPENPPLVVDMDNGNQIIDLPTSIKHDRKLTLGCPGDDECNSNKFKLACLKPQKQWFVQCRDGLLYDTIVPEPDDQKILNYKNWGCEGKISSTIKEDIQQPGADKCPVKMYTIGYDMKFFNDDEDFHPLIKVCFDDGNLNTIWTTHTIHGKYLNNKDTENKNPPGFKEFGLFPLIKMDEIYRQESQFILYSKELNNKDIICQEYKPNFLSKGHMAPKADFVTKIDQDATFYYINSQPQWKSINEQGGNWAAIERRTRILAMTRYSDIKIFTGGFRILEMNKKGTNEDVEIKLGNLYFYKDDDSEDEEINVDKLDKVPAPAVTWKIVIHKNEITNKIEGVAFVVVNNPFDDGIYTYEPECPDRCADVTWLPTTAVTLTEYRTRGRGITYCCEIPKFLNAYNGINTGLKVDDDIIKDIKLMEDVLG